IIRIATRQSPLAMWQAQYVQKQLEHFHPELKAPPPPPGRYSAVITTLENVPDFNGIESFVEVNYFNPKI
ncbi:DUF5625 family protein, partial [Xenorhabdus hominickii]|uniref:DUF5625 family protein n=1 Tax=Xenorhabdus hominickii TaxID=351679 RepID=UPI001FCE81A9